MLTFPVQKTIETPVKFLRAECGVRYWEDAKVNGVVDEDGSLIPCRKGSSWCPLIDLETGVIQEWPEGTEADIHYKVCDDGAYALIGEDGDEVAAIDGYVPRMMCPEENGYGDYVIMKIDGTGKINKWEPDMAQFGELDERGF